MALLEFTADKLKIDVSCSKGTYIRVLAEDIGSALGCGATLAGLRRTRVGEFDLARAVTLTAVEGFAEFQRMATLLPVDCLSSGLPALALDAESAWRILRGQAASVNDAAKIGLVRLYGPERQFLGLGELRQGGCLRPKRLVATTGVPSTALAR